MSSPTPFNLTHRNIENSNKSVSKIVYVHKVKVFFDNHKVKDLHLRSLIRLYKLKDRFESKRDIGTYREFILFLFVCYKTRYMTDLVFVTKASTKPR